MHSKIKADIDLHDNFKFIQMIKIANLLAIMLIIFSSCRKSDYTTHYSNGKIKTFELELNQFTGILLDCKCELIINRGESQKVEVTVSENIVEDIDLSVKNNIWIIDFKDDNIATYNNHKFTIVIESPNIQTIEMQSSGSITYYDTIVRNELSINHLSSGNVSVICKTNNLTTLMDGSGKLVMKGSTKEHILKHLSSGKVDAGELVSSNCNLYHDGSGDTFINVTTSLSGFMNGSGYVRYVGNPTVDISGDSSDKLIHQ